MEPEKRVSVTTGFWVLLAILFYLDEGLDLLGWGLLACGCHELGHLIAVRALGGRISRLRLTVVGAELSLDPELPLSYGRECLAALAGPLANLFLAGLAMRGRLFLLAGLSLGQGLFNLLPIRTLPLFPADRPAGRGPGRPGAASDLCHCGRIAPGRGPGSGPAVWQPDAAHHLPVAVRRAVSELEMGKCGAIRKKCLHFASCCGIIP